MSLSAWLMFVLTEAALCVSPGPAVLFVVSCGLARGAAASLWANGGILAGNAAYFVLSALGVGGVLLASPAVFHALRVAGACYLLYLGVQALRGGGPATLPDGAAGGATGHAVFTRAFVLQLANPKALVFFAALLPQFIDPARPAAPQIAILALTSIAIEFVVLAGYGLLAGRASSLAHDARFTRATHVASGALLVAAAVGLGLLGGW